MAEGNVNGGAPDALLKGIADSLDDLNRGLAALNNRIGSLKDLPQNVSDLGDVLAPEGLSLEALNRLIDAATTDGVRHLRGYLGPRYGISPTRPGHRRLYLNLDFNDYLDIPQGDIVRWENLATPFNKFAGFVFWVRVGAKIVRESSLVGKPEVEGRFLSGGSGGAGRGEDWTSLGRGEDWTSLGRGEDWTSLGRGEDWTSLGRG